MPLKELSVKDWNNEIDQGFEYRRRFGIEDLWAEVEALFYNVHHSQHAEAPNLIFSTGEAMMSNLTVPDPYILIDGQRQDSLEAARVLEFVDNLLIEDMNMKPQVEDAVLHAYLWGIGFLKIGYDSEWGWDARQDIGENQDFGMTLTQFDQKGRRIEFASSVRSGMPWVKAVMPHDLVVPWGTKTLDDAPWVAHRVVRHVDDIKSDVKYSNKRNLKPIMSMEDFTHSYLSPAKTFKIGQFHTRTGQDAAMKMNEFVELFEIHDKRSGKILVIATGHDKFLRKDDNLLQIEGLPFTEVRFTPRTRALWTTSDAVYLRAAQAELTDISIQATKHRRLSVLKFLYQEGTIDETELDKLLSSEVGLAVKVKVGIDPNTSIKMLQPPVNIALRTEGEQVRRDARELVGFSRNQLGEFEASGRRTAREAVIVQTASGVRLNRRQTSVRDLYINSFKKINEFLFKFWRTPQIAQVLDDEGVKKWVRFTGDDIRGVYKYDVDFVDKAQLAQRRQEALGLLGVLGQNPRANIEALENKVKAAFNSADIDAILPGGQQDANLSLPVPEVQQGGGGSPPIQGGG